MKHCPKCESDKLEAEFGRNAAKEDGLQAYCLPCMRAYSAQKRKKKPDGWKRKTEDLVAYRREYRATHKAERQAWEAAHPEYVAKKALRNLERSKLRYWKNRAPIERTRMSEEEARRRKNVRRYTRRKVAQGKIQVLPCLICGEKAEAHHPDYSQPLDVVWLCRKHHLETHAMVK